MKVAIALFLLTLTTITWFTWIPPNNSTAITPPTKQDAILMCPGEEPIYPDKWKLEDGRIIIQLGRIYMIAPMQCGLVSLYPEAATKEASK